MKIIFLTFVSLFLFHNLGAEQFWVATDGNDLNAGSKTAPFATITRAQEAVRTYISAGGRGKITVNVRGGTYRLAAPLSFGPQDSARNAKVIYRAVKGETPIVTGAIPVSGWVLLTDGLYVADLSALAPGKTRQLYVNGERMPRARTPDYPSSFRPLTFEVDGEWHTPGIEYIPNPDLNPTIPDPSTWKNQSQIEALIITQWKMSICRVQSITPYVDPLPGLIEMQEPGWNNANAYRDPSTGEPSVWCFWQVTRFENALEFLDQPGEWYFDESSAELYYMPPPEQDISTARVELPQLEKLIDIVGTAENPVGNLTFQGFTFTGATWTGPSSAEGYVADQSGFHLTGEQEPNYIGHSQYVTRTPGNISLRHASKIEFRDNIFEHLGAVAIDLVTGCSQNKIIGNIFRDISSAAIQIGGVSADDARPVDSRSICRKNLVIDNYIYQTGRDYFDSAAIMIGFTQNTEIKYNTIADVPWSGIAIGWGWGLLDEGSFPGVPGAVSGQWGIFDTPTVAENNKIIGNDISNFLNVVWDGGSIYTTGQQGPTLQKGTLIYRNVAHDKRPEAGGNTFYTDGGSRYLRLISNVSYNNPVGVSDFGPSPDPLDPLPYPYYSIFNDIPYGSDTGGCRTYGDIQFIGNYWLSGDYFSIYQYIDSDGISYPVNLKYYGNHIFTGQRTAYVVPRIGNSPGH